MAAGAYPRDPGLTTRMAATMALLAVLYAGFVYALLAIGLSVVFVGIIAGGLLFAQYWFSDRLVLAAMHAREVGRGQYPQLHATVERLAALADMPMPRIAVADMDVPNAFATGRSPDNAVVAVTTGLLRRLEPHELEAVMAHELSHVAHRDVLVMTIASFIGVVAGFLTRIGLHAGMWGGHGYGRRRNGESAAAAFMMLVVVSALVYVVSFLLTRALSRYRELAADRGGAVLTGRPSALASALVKISGEMGRIPTRDLREVEPVNAFLFAPAISRGFSLSTLFATHPPIEQRLEQLSRLEGQLGRRG